MFQPGWKSQLLSWTRDIKSFKSADICDLAAATARLSGRIQNERTEPVPSSVLSATSGWKSCRKRVSCFVGASVLLLSSHLAEAEVWAAGRKSIGRFPQRDLALSSIRNIRTNYCKCTQLREAHTQKHSLIKALWCQNLFLLHCLRPPVEVRLMSWTKQDVMTSYK